MPQPIAARSRPMGARPSPSWPEDWTVSAREHPAAGDPPRHLLISEAPPKLPQQYGCVVVLRSVTYCSARSSRRCWSPPMSSCRTLRRARQSVWGSPSRSWNPQHPGLIVCDISGYGTGGHCRAHEGVRPHGAERGRGAVGDRQPRGSGEGGDLHLRHRRRHVRVLVRARRPAAAQSRPGEGSHLDVSMLEATVEWMGFPLYYSYDGAEPASARRCSARDDLPVQGRSPRVTARR